MDWKAFAHVLGQIAPLVLMIIPGVPPILIPSIVNGIQAAEQFGGTGAEKKAAAIATVKSSIAVANLVAQREVVDPTAIHAVSNGIDTVVGVVNLLKSQPVAPDKDLD